ncbi:FkbM family methyltransferase [Halomonas sp. NyZ770]|uniref:FkbM family methyltransferase n=1 Tax=Halomonas sp. NyZ770 TaxID=2883106 RepID=UPI001D0B8007|nr:FkbM family methyltransferase [Halomonas sp. NyZ770]UDM08496.1 FkbM family methyltransferase [Halomonas sp. NyZ770]
MKSKKFAIQARDKQYFMFLPDHETDYIQKYLADKGRPYELEMLEAMFDVLKKDDLVLDVGANIGNHSLCLAVVANSYVFAFEPNKKLSDSMKQSVATNKLQDRVTVISKGVGACYGKGVFKESIPHNLGAQALTLVDDKALLDGEEVEVVSLDSFEFNRKVKAIKVDVEGMEVDVLKGAVNILLNDRPNLFVESHNEEQFLKVHAILDNLGYVYWRTFNATPTNWFVHLDSVSYEELQCNSLLQGKSFYKLWEERQKIRSSYLQLREKYNTLNVMISETRRGVENSDSLSVRKDDYDKLANGSECSVSSTIRREDFFIDSSKPHPERSIGLDFSLPETRNKG